MPYYLVLHYDAYRIAHFFGSAGSKRNRKCYPIAESFPDTLVLVNDNHLDSIFLSMSFSKKR
jgi:hypothetical protein